MDVPENGHKWLHYDHLLIKGLSSDRTCEVNLLQQVHIAVSTGDNPNVQTQLDISISFLMKLKMNPAVKLVV